MFKCTDCNRTISKIEDIRNCPTCRAKGRSQNILDAHDDDDMLTSTIIGYVFSLPDEPPTPTPSFVGGGGEFGGAGASASFDPGDSSCSSSGSSSSDSSSSCDSGGGGGGD